MLDNFRQGDRELGERFNELFAAARKINRMSGDEHIKVRHTANGINISMDRIPKGGGGGGGGARRAFVKTTPGAVETVVCWLSDTDGVGDEITVYCDVVGGSALNAALPRLADGEPILVTSVSGKWRCTWGFQTICNA